MFALDKSGKRFVKAVDLGETHQSVQPPTSLSQKPVTHSDVSLRDKSQEGSRRGETLSLLASCQSGERGGSLRSLRHRTEQIYKGCPANEGMSHLSAGVL